MADSGRTVLITGASSGIGLVTAHLMLDQGWNVFAAARRQVAMDSLQRRGAVVLPLDISDDQSRADLAAEILDRTGGRLDALVNNAGYGEVGPMETMGLDRARSMFEVNVFGLMGLSQLFLPAMRDRQAGRIVNVSSIAGRFATPGAGWYCASKHALEAISDAMRIELAQFGIQVVLVEPGLIRTGFEEASAESMAQGGEDPVWGAMMKSIAAGWAESFRKGSDPQLVARTIATALQSRNPKSRYLCGSESEAVLIQPFIPAGLWDGLLRRRLLGT
ncbi:SDR family NAD(P)-dependent oxidoreductase [Synechococcus sp. AH-551-E05]|nr:SDR family NAD(P)-dependent oxidoreductase [Synechococcus sp. AH-551-E05]MDB4651242.1 SDR family NAD(P)-dependent oxidoreductase [Synechococcus sp. AH-551-E05]